MAPPGETTSGRRATAGNGALFRHGRPPFPEWRRGQGTFLEMQQTGGARWQATVACGSVRLALPGMETWACLCLEMQQCERNGCL